MEKNKDEIKVKGSNWLRKLFKAFLIILLIPVFFILLIQLSPVQKWLVKKTTSYLSKELEADVNIASFDFSIFEGIKLGKFSIVEDSDTIISAASLNVRLSKNLFSLFDNSLGVSYIDLKSPKVHLVHESSTDKLNLIRLLEKISNPDNKGDKKNFYLDVKNVSIDNLDFSLINQISNTILKAKVENGEVKFRKLDVNKQIFNIRSLKLINPIVDNIRLGKAIEKSHKDTTSNNGHRTSCIEIDKLFVKGGLYNSQSTPYYKVNKKSEFDLNDLKVVNLNIDLENFIFGGINDVYTKINELSFKTDNGFELNKFISPSLLITNDKIQLKDFKVETGKSKIGNNILITYNDFADLKDFADKAFIESDFENTSIAFQDLSYFIPSLGNSSFIKNKNQSSIYFNGKIVGRLNNLKGKELELKLDDQIDFVGNFGLKNINKKGDEFLNLKVDLLRLNINTLKQLIPGFDPPVNFYTLGNLDFKGGFDGFLKDFTAYGKLKTDIGTADLDMKLDVTRGNQKARYSGDLFLENFNLNKWSGGNQDLGKVTLKANIRDGESLILKNANADLQASIKLFQYKGYDYTNIDLNGQISPKQFNGTLFSTDPNFNFDFDGSVFFTESLPKFDFKSNIRNISLNKLNLSSDISQVKGNITFKGTGDNINNILGEVNATNFFLTKNDSIYNFKSLSLASKQLANNKRQLEFKSDLADIYLEGKYNLNTIISDVKSLVKTNFPFHTRSWKVETKPLSDEQQVKFDINLKSINPIVQMLGLNDVDLKTFKGKGYLDSKNKELNFVSSLPVLLFKDYKLFNTQIVLNNKGNKGDLLVHFDSLYQKNNKYNSADIQFVMKGDDIDFLIDSKNFIDSIQNINIKGVLSPHPKGYSISVLNNDLRIYNRRWKVNNQAVISLGDKFIDINNFSITDGTRNILINDIDNKGISVKLDKVDVDVFNPFINYSRIIFSGELSSNIKINNIFNPSPSITGNAVIDGLKLNNENFGEVLLDLSKGEDKPLEALLSLSNPSTGQALKIKGFYDLETQNLNADIKAKKLSLKWLEYILKNGVRNLKGHADLDANVYGNIKNLKIDGNAVANEGSVQVIYLGETYFFDKQKFKITENRIDFTGAKLKDSQGNEGVITGGLSHKLFSNFVLDANISGEDVIIIKTSKFDNPIYYGLGKGFVNVDFIGSVDAPKMIINATTKSGTKINIPIKESRGNADKSIINYIKKDDFYNNVLDNTKEQKKIKVDGISVEMNLTMTEEAQVNLIFDEIKNDIIRGVGRGNLRISMSNKGEFDMFGTYTITSGEYLFTASSFVNKPFVVREGGVIRWTGDPINASIDIVADYPVRTTLTNFIGEYLVSDQLKQAAAQTTDVNLKLKLGNTLFNPTVKFDFEFPSLSGELKSFTDSKIRLLKNNEVEYNSQVFGLVVFNSFTPSSTINAIFANNNFIQNAGVNTLSEFIGSQFSIYVTSLINNALEDNGLISGVDFDLNLINNTSFLGANTQATLLPTEIQVRLKNRFRFLDERLTVNIGGNYVRQNPLGNLNNYLIPEFFIEYALTKDRQLNLKLYGKYDLDEIAFLNRRQKFGLGLRYKTEFGSMRESKTLLKEAFKKVVVKNPS